MQTIIRVKRPLEESPSDTLILNCNKKRKLAESSVLNEPDEPLLAVLKFTGTQNTQDDDISEYVTNIRGTLKEKLSCSYKKFNVDIDKKLREEARENSKNNRFKVINCLRSNFPPDETEKKLTIYDLELEDGKKSMNSKYVFDLYYANTNVLDEIEQYNVSIYPTSENLVFDSDDVYNLDEENDDSEDSNAENNWRNDYPDESDDAESIDENDMVEAMKNFDINDTLSSEDENAYCIDNNEEYDYKLNDLDEKKYGRMYAKFKAQNKDTSESEDENSLVLSDDDDYNL